MRGQTVQQKNVRATSEMALLSVITCVMNVRDQTRQASVTSSGPLCDYSCHFVHEPKKVKSTSSGQRWAFQDN